jgi:hypothetical protein
MKIPRGQFTVRRMMIAVALVSILFHGIVLALRPEYFGLTLVNRSGQSISQLIVTSSGEESLIQNLTDGSTATVRFQSHDDPRLDLAGALEGGTRVRSWFRIAGNPKRFAHIVGTIDQGGKLRLSLGQVGTP